MINSTITNVKKAIFSMGLPGAGKSYTLSKHYNVGEFTIIDPDEIKKEKVDYDPKNPSVYHEWSKVEAKLRTQEAINNNENLIIDGTGTNVPKMVNDIKRLQDEGYEVEVVYVKVKLETAIERNNKRERTVPLDIVMEKYEQIESAVQMLQNVPNKFTVINND